MSRKEKLPSKEQILEKINQLMDDKNYSEAAKVIVYYTVAKMDPDEFAKKLVDAVKEYQQKKRGKK